MHHIKEYTLKNEYLTVCFINLGATITKLIDRKTGINILVGHHDLEVYRENPGYMNSIIGRHAGRIEDVVLDGQKMKLNKYTNDDYQLHGGIKGFHMKYFDVVEGKNSLTFQTSSDHLEEGYPGQVNFKITYQLINNELHLNYEAVSTEKTIMNFTNHAYFNLSGNIGHSILNHELMINADDYIELQENMVPFNRATVSNTPLDFRQMKSIGSDIDQDFKQLRIANGYDHPFIVNKMGHINHVATLHSNETKITLDVYSDQEVVVLYTGNFIDENFVLNDGVQGSKHCALCLETQGVPNAQHLDKFKENNIVNSDEIYRQTTIWRIMSNSK